jgi:hypothetical protein
MIAAHTVAKPPLPKPDIKQHRVIVIGRPRRRCLNSQRLAEPEKGYDQPKGSAKGAKKTLHFKALM